MSAEVTKIIKELAATYVKDESPCVDERVARHWWGEWDEEVSFALGMADLVSDEPAAKHLYEWRCAGDMSGELAVQRVSDWAKAEAARFASKRNSRKRPTIQSYRPDWGRQAGHDGVCLAMWGEGIRDMLPGVNKRSERFGCTNDAYQRVRDHVQHEAHELIFQFKRDLEMAVTGKFDPDFRCRWERKTGKQWPR
jgi:hypothetical protein